MKTNLIPFNKVALLSAAVCAAVMLAFTQNASAVVINPDDQLVGSVTPGIPSNPTDETAYVNELISLAANTQNFFDPVTGQTYNRTAFDTTGLPAAANPDKTDVDGGPITLTLDGTFTYILAKYDAARAGSLVWYVGGLIGEFTIPATFNGHDLSHYTVFGGGGGVPDGGTTVMLLGAALGALGVVRRYLIS